ncbi:hypothetical protein [Cognataquiflexum rubidum]|uniref:hypothetical protein n=1 Tax=Cognataquiflexum rubidum TaxID=2922273 RepID=UPI001F13049D|nr:hypothetical protein [Cognataquiflexum rubidum]MCH6234898.1 hypothetical protein [Cognataquiflexum rubidum]
MKKLKMIVFFAFSACTFNEDSFEKNDQQNVIKEILGLVNNPDAYNFVVPEKINPFEVTIKFEQKINQIDINDYSRKSESDQLPEELVNANKEFRELTMSLVAANSLLSFENFNKLAYAIELKIIDSELSKIKRDFILKELAMLRFYSELKSKSLNSESDRIQCDYECRWNGCMEAKIISAFGSTSTYLGIAWTIFNMPYDMLVWNAECLYASVEPAP